MADTQISAHVSAETKALLDHYVEAQGVKKGRLIEDALLHHLQALRELPADVIIPPRLVVTQASFERILAVLEGPPARTETMKALLDGHDVGDP